MSLAREAVVVSHGISVDRDMIVAKKETVAGGVVALTLTDSTGENLPEWAPGAHIDVEISTGVVRQYSLCGSTDDQQSWTIAVLREEGGRGGSRHIHDELGQGSLVRVLALRNLFPLEPAERYLFIAGGIGITPIIPMLAAAEADHRPWRLYYGGRSRDSMAFAHDLAAQYGPNVVIHPEDEYGMLDLAAILNSAEPGQHVYCCGPTGLISAVEERCRQHWPDGRVHVERFTADTGALATDVPFEVVLRSTGEHITIPADRSILAVLNEDHGMELISGCEQGICGTCEINVVDGVPDHRDQVLSAEERELNTSMMTCVSRCLKGPLTLDL